MPYFFISFQIIQINKKLKKSKEAKIIVNQY
jgi:hypothetical protein